MSSLLVELKRRNVFRVGIAYAAVSWVILQFVDVVAPILALPDAVPRIVLALLAGGFIPALILAWVFEVTPQGIKREKNVDRSVPGSVYTGRRLDFVIIGVLAVGIVFLLVDKFSGAPPLPEPVLAAPSIAVLPFVNMSSDPEQQYFSDGITEEILNSLASTPRLKVAGRTSSFAFRGQGDDLRRIGETLGVGHILEGSVRKSGSRVRITAQLVDVDDGFNVWSQTYEREMTDVFAIQDEISDAIIRELRVRLLDESAQAPASQPTSPEAYDRYLAARMRMYDRSQASLEDAVRKLIEVIDLDPGYAPAYAQLGIATMLLADDSYGEIPREEAREQGKRYLDLALELDPKSWEALAGLGLYYQDVLGGGPQAIEVLRRSLALNPSQLDARLWLANTLMNMGDAAGNLAELEALMEVDPLFHPAFTNAVAQLEAHGMSDKAMALIERVRPFDPEDPGLLQAEATHLLFKGDDMVGAVRLAEKVYQMTPNSMMVDLFYKAAMRQTQQLERLVDAGPGMLTPGALDALGRKEEALQQALDLAEVGAMDPLFALYNRRGQSEALVAYLEDRWPTLEAYASDIAPDQSGYSSMLSIAYAYRRTDNEARFAEAIALYEDGVARMRAQGIDNRFLDFETAMYHAVVGETDEAFAILESDHPSGTFSILPLGRFIPEFDSLTDDPRFVAIEEAALASVNEQRAGLGLDPIDPSVAFWQDDPAQPTVRP